MRQMTDVTYFVALPFVFSDDGVAAGEAAECLSANAAVMRAEALSRKPGHAGPVAFSRTGEPSSGDFSDATLIRKFGDVPEDLSALLSCIGSGTRSRACGASSAPRSVRSGRCSGRPVDGLGGALLSRMRAKVDDLCRERDALRQGACR
jgi:hypothetical protein